MTLPNVSISWCNRTAKCEWCPEQVKAGKPMVTASFWNRAPDTNKRFNVRKYYHPNCWVEQGLDYLKRNPYVPYLRKPKLELTEEQSKHRYRLLRHKAAINQRIKKLGDTPNKLDEVRLQVKITEIMLEIAPIGGIPRKWLL